MKYIIIIIIIPKPANKSTAESRFRLPVVECNTRYTHWRF